MNLNQFSGRKWLILLGAALQSAASIGCQSTVGGQTLPSAYYLRDDVQFFPAGPEFILSRQVEALEEYKLRQQGAAEAEAPAPASAPVEEPAPAAK